MRDLDVFVDTDSDPPWLAVCYRRFTGARHCKWTVAGVSLGWPPDVTFERLDGRVTSHSYTDHTTTED